MKAKSAKQIRLDAAAALTLRMVAEPLDLAEMAEAMQERLDLHGFANLNSDRVNVIRMLMAAGFTFDFCSAEGLGVEGAIAKREERQAVVSK